MKSRRRNIGDGGAPTMSTNMNDAWKYVHPADENQTLTDQNDKSGTFASIVNVARLTRLDFTTYPIQQEIMLTTMYRRNFKIAQNRNLLMHRMGILPLFNLQQRLRSPIFFLILLTMMMI